MRICTCECNGINAIIYICIHKCTHMCAASSLCSEITDAAGLVRQEEDVGKEEVVGKATATEAGAQATNGLGFRV